MAVKYVVNVFTHSPLFLKAQIYETRIIMQQQYLGRNRISSFKSCMSWYIKVIALH